MTLLTDCQLQNTAIKFLSLNTGLWQNKILNPLILDKSENSHPTTCSKILK